MKKIGTFGYLIIGIVICVVTIFVGLALTKVLNFHQIRTLKWLPILLTGVGFYIAGFVNRKTKLIFLPLLLVSLLVFIPIRFFYFPFILVLIMSALLALFLSRKEFQPMIRIFSFVVLIGIFGYYLFSQPLIIRGKNFSVDAMGNMHNAKVLWDFTKFSPTKVPDYTFHDVHGKEFQLADFKGKTLYVSFWATWCGPCMAQKPKLEEIKKKFEANESILFVDISLDRKIDAWKTFLAEHTPKGIQLNSPNEKQVRDIFKIAGIPHNIIVHPDGTYKAISRPTQLEEVHYELFTNEKSLKDYVSKPVMYFNK